MDYEKIILLSDPRKIGIVKEVVEALKEKIPQLRTTPFRYGKLGEEVVISFNADKKYYLLLVEKLTYNGFQIFTNDEQAKRIINDARMRSGQGKDNWDDIIFKSRKNITQKGLDDFIREGDYREVIKVSKDYALPKEISEKAKNNIPAAISNAIENLFGIGLLRKFETTRSISRLVEISADPLLKTMHFGDLAKQAGIYAVDLCTRYKDNLVELIYIANNNSLNNVVNVKAAVTFADVILSSPENYDEELRLAIKDLNIKWLSIAANVVWNDLEQAEKDKLDALLNFIKANRS